MPDTPTPEQRRADLERRGFKLSPCCARPTEYVRPHDEERDVRRCPCGKQHVI